MITNIIICTMVTTAMHPENGVKIAPSGLIIAGAPRNAQVIMDNNAVPCVAIKATGA